MYVGILLWDAHLRRHPRKNFKILFLMFVSQEIGSGSVSFEIIFEALKSEPFRFTFHLLSSKILKISGFNLIMGRTSIFVATQGSFKGTGSGELWNTWNFKAKNNSPDPVPLTVLE